MNLAMPSCFYVVYSCFHAPRAVDTIMTELDVFTTWPFAEKVCRAQLYVLISDAVLLWTPRGKRPREEYRIQALVLRVKEQK